MSIAEMKKAIIAHVDEMPEIELKQLLATLEKKEQSIDEYILANYKRVIQEKRSLLQRLAQ